MHICSLTDTSTSYLPPLPPDASRLRRFCRRVRKALLISEENPRTRLLFRSNASVFNERKRHVQSKYLYVIHPYSMFRVYWEAFMSVIFVGSLSTIPIDIFYGFYTLNRDIASTQLLLGFYDLVCITDIIVCCFTGYDNPSTKEVILEPARIFWMYLKHGQFVLDVITSFPYNVINYMIDRQTVLGRVIRLAGFVKGLRSRVLYKYLHRMFDNWYVNKNVYRLIIYGLFSLLCVHWTACLHLIIPLCLKTYNRLTNESWLIKHTILGRSPPEAYMIALYRAIATFLCIRHTSKITESMEDVIFMVLSYLVGYVLGVLIFVFLLQMILSLNTPSTKYESIMNQLHQYMRHRQLPISLQQRLVQYYAHVFKKSYFRESAIMPLLSDRLQLEITLHCYGTLIENVTILHDLSDDAVNEIVSSLRLEVFLPNDIIIKAGTFGECMYFILTGTVAISTTTGREVCHLQDGAYFGEVALIKKDQKRVANVVAIEICEVYRLDRKVFKNCIATHVEVYKKLEKLAQERTNRTNFLEELHKKHILERTLARKHELID